MAAMNLISVHEWEAQKRRLLKKEAEHKDVVAEIHRKKEDALGRTLNQDLHGDLFVSVCFGSKPAYAGCDQDDEIDCNVLYQRNVELARDFSDFKEYGRVYDEDQEYFCPPFEHCFVDKMGSDTLARIFRKLRAYFLEFGSDDLAYNLSHLPKPKILAPGTLSSGHIIRFQTPSDFHMILDDFSSYNHALKENGWTHYFKREGEFYSTNQIFRGLTILLSFYVKYLDSTSDIKPETLTYYPDDMVVVCILRKDDVRRPGYLAYRGCIIQSVKAINEDMSTAEGYLVYLLDTGEQHIVSSLYMIPIPIQFLGFAPLAIPCAIHGVSPIGEGWNKAARDLMRATAIPKKTVILIAEFYSKKEQARDDLTLPFVNDKPYFVELTVRSPRAHLGKSSAVRNVSSELIRERVGLEWTLCPQRATLRCTEEPKRMLPHHTELGNKRVPALTREEALISVGPVPQPVTKIPEKQVFQEVTRLCSLRKKHFNNMFIPDVSNILCLRMEDPRNSLGEKCVPALFLKDKDVDNELASHPESPPVELHNGPKEGHQESEDDDEELDLFFQQYTARFELLKQAYRTGANTEDKREINL